MRVLFLTKTPAGASSHLKNNYPGCGWIAALEEKIKAEKDIVLGVCFFNNEVSEFKFKLENVTYYPVTFSVLNKIDKIRSRISYKLSDSNIAGVQKAIDDFKPDLIQLFGTESGIGEVLAHTDIPAVIHIQGLVNPILASWFPKGISQTQVIRNSSLKDLVFRTSLYNEYHVFRKKAVREESIVKRAKYFFGRTNWDREIVGLLNTDFEYFHCNEILRPAFYQANWRKKTRSELVLVSVMNPSIYKGLDTILDAACLLRRYYNIDFKWRVYGMNSNNNTIRLFERIKGEKFIDNNVEICGSKSEEQLLSCLLDADVYIHPSHIDNSPNSVCEAQMLGLPVISTKVGGIGSIIENEVNGLLYNSGDPYELVFLIKRLEKDLLLRNKISKNAADTAHVRHDVTSIISTIKESYYTMLNTSGSSFSSSVNEKYNESYITLDS